LPYHRKCTLLLQPPEQQEAMIKNFKYRSLEPPKLILRFSNPNME